MSTVRVSACGGIYAITNTLNGQQYIGSALNFSNRWKQHRFHLNHSTHHNQHLQRAWHLYGQRAFTFTVIECVADPSQLLVREQYYLDTAAPAYNTCLIAGSTLGHTPSAKQRAAMVEFNKRQVYTPERLQRMSEITREQWRQPGAREKQGASISAGQRVFYAANPEFGRQRNACLRGKPLDITDEERQRRRERGRGLSAIRWAKVRAAQSADNSPTAAQLTLWE